jgi:hypothetical protein
MDNSRIADYVKQLNDKTEYVRRPVVEATVKIGTLDVPALMKALKDKDGADHWRIQKALAEIGARAVPALIEGLKDNVWHVRWHAALALREIADATAVPALIEALKDGDPDVRWAAAEALGEIADATAVPALVEALKDVKSSVRNDAAIALGKIGDVSAVPVLLEVLKNSDEGVRRCAVEGLQKLGDSETLPRKILAVSQLSTQERIEILDALRRVRYNDRFPTLVRYPTLHYTFPDTRTLCQTILNDSNAGASAEARMVLDWLDGDQHLAVVSQRDLESDPQELHSVSQRGAESDPEELHSASEGETPPTRHETLLRGTDAPHKDADQSSQRRSLRARLGTFWERLFAKRKAVVK